MGKYKVIEYSTDIHDPRYYDFVYTFKVVGGDITGNGIKEIKAAIESLDEPFITVNVPDNFDVAREASKMMAIYTGRGNGKTQYMLNILRQAWGNKFYPIKVIFHDPATIVFWDDGTKTVVKCQEGDTYNKELGFALCFAKKAMGNQSNFNNTFNKFLDN